MALRSRLRQVLAKIEGTYGVDAAPTGAANAVLLRSVQPTPLEQETTDRTLVRPFFGGFEKLPTRSMVRLELEMEAVGFGAAGPAEPTAGYDALLRACGLAPTITAGTSVAYLPISEGHESATLYFYQDGTLHKLLGARGTLVAQFVVNEIPVFRFSFLGLYGGVTDAALPTIDIDAYQIPQVVNSENTQDFAIHGLTTAALRSLSIDLGNQLVMRNLVNTDEEILITDRNPSGQMQIEATPVATKDWWSTVRNVTIGSLLLRHGSPGRRIEISSDRVQIVSPAFTDQDNIVEMTAQLNFLPETGDDEIAITIL